MEQDVVKSAQPLVSVVTPVYNGEAYIAECIKRMHQKHNGPDLFELGIHHRQQLQHRCNPKNRGRVRKEGQPHSSAQQ